MSTGAVLARERAAAGSGLLVEMGLLLILFAIAAWTSARMQHVTVTRYWDGDILHDDGADRGSEVPHASAPFVYRLATPWLVARF